MCIFQLRHFWNCALQIEAGTFSTLLLPSSSLFNPLAMLTCTSFIVLFFSVSQDCSVEYRREGKIQFSRIEILPTMPHHKIFTSSNIHDLGVLTSRLYCSVLQMSEVLIFFKDTIGSLTIQEETKTFIRYVSSFVQLFLAYCLV